MNEPPLYRKRASIYSSDRNTVNPIFRYSSGRCIGNERFRFTLIVLSNAWGGSLGGDDWQAPCSLPLPRIVHGSCAVGWRRERLGMTSKARRNISQGTHPQGGLPAPLCSVMPLRISAPKLTPRRKLATTPRATP